MAVASCVPLSLVAVKIAASSFFILPRQSLVPKMPSLGVLSLLSSLVDLSVPVGFSLGRHTSGHVRRLQIPPVQPLLHHRRVIGEFVAMYGGVYLGLGHRCDGDALRRLPVSAFILVEAEPPSDGCHPGGMGVRGSVEVRC